MRSSKAGVIQPRLVDSSEPRLSDQTQPTAPSRTRRRVIVAGALLVADVAATVVALLLISIVPGIGVLDPPGFTRLGAETATLIGILGLFGLYTGLETSPFERLRLRTLGVIAFCAIDLGMHAGWTPLGALRAGLLLPVLLAFGHYVELAVRLCLERRGLWAARVLVIGDGPRGEHLIRELAAKPVLGLRPIAMFTPLASGAADISAGTLSALPSISNLQALEEPIDVAIAVCPTSLKAFERLSSRQQQVACFLLLNEGPNGESLWLRMHAFGSSLAVEVRREGRLDRSRWLKRALDLVITVTVAVPSAFLVALAAVAVKVVDPGPAFYTQRRIGENGRPVDIVKIRTMYQDADLRLKGLLSRNPEARTEWERFFKLRDDPRILPFVGSFIRKSSLDELPQLWNIMRGDMSIVGPRCLPEYHLNRFDAEFRKLRSSVPPGLTGQWQISARSNGDLEVQRAEDLFYIQNRSFWLDLYIMLQTIPAILSTKGAR